MLGLAIGAANAVAAGQAAEKNQQMITEEARLRHAANEREFIVETDAANKDAYQAQLEADRMRSEVITAGGGMSGATMAARGAEQGRQGALSIANAKDRRDAAGANYALSGKEIQITAKNQLNTAAVNPLTAFTNVATSGLQYYGAFK